MFLTTTYHPHDNFLRTLIHNNWDMLGRSPTTDLLHQKHLMSGYRRPKNLRDLLVRAQLPPKEGDYLEDPQHLDIPEPQPEPVARPPSRGKRLQKSILDFFRRTNTSTSTSVNTTNTTPMPATIKPKHWGSSNKERGFSFCNLTHCRYCPKLNKPSQIHCPVTNSNHVCMKNISCRSSNLIYAITCTRCGMQYVGQTLLRIKDRFVHHFRDIELMDKEKSVSKHFSQGSHNGVKDVQISVLEFIKKPPRSPQAVVIRNRVEKRWTHLLRSLAPYGLNIENPKEYIGKTTQTS